MIRRVSFELNNNRGGYVVPYVMTEQPGGSRAPLNIITGMDGVAMCDTIRIAAGICAI